MAEKFEGWNDTCNRYVVFLDIMGFRDRVYREKHEDTEKMFVSFYPTIASIEKEAQIRLGPNYPLPQVKKVFGKAFVRPIIFSDSILLISSDDSRESAHNVLFYVGWVFKDALITGIPLKGAIAHGKQTADFSKSLHFGRPLIDAFDLQDQLQIYGVVLHHTMEKQLEKINMLKSFQSFGALTKYKVPTRSGKISHYLVDWTSHQPITENSAYDLVYASYYNVSGSPRVYVDNTLDFLEYLKNEKVKTKKKEKP